MKAERHKKPRPPLDGEALERLALFYVGRYATTEAKLRSYLGLKLKERGWRGEGDPALNALLRRLIDLGYIDDAAFASARAASLQRRGFGERRIVQALFAAGIDEEASGDAREQSRAGAWQAALRFAERKRIGPYAASRADREQRQKAFAAMMRAGHPVDIARRVIEAAPGDIPESDSI